MLFPWFMSCGIVESYVLELRLDSYGRGLYLESYVLKVIS